MKYQYFDRDLSWLSFNYRLLLEADREEVPLFERIKFLSIYSSNLDEFSRVRMPALMALHKLHKKEAVEKSEKKKYADVWKGVQETIQRQLEFFGRIFTGKILPRLKENNIRLYYNEPFPSEIEVQAEEIFFTEILAFLQPIELTTQSQFFPENNKCYLLVSTHTENNETFLAVNIPSEELQRFYSFPVSGTRHVVFIDDIIKANLSKILHGKISHAFSFKVTRDAELELRDEYEGDIAEKIERQIEKRDLGLATRLLYQADIDDDTLRKLTEATGLAKATGTPGGVYHNLKDLVSLPGETADLSCQPWPSINHPTLKGKLLFSEIEEGDILLHTPYMSFNLVLRFFNEAAVNPDVEEIYVTLYRVAKDSRIAGALISAAKNGKQVAVFVELKARFDEANNIKWAKKMKAAGIKIIYSIPALKVHAKIALVKKREGEQIRYYGLLSTGNLNESTARFYTDHVLLTVDAGITDEISKLFNFLAERRKPVGRDELIFDNLLVAQFNLQDKFLTLIEREIKNANGGIPASIIIKLNNLEEHILIDKLYEASQAGVKIELIVRGICCLIPGVSNMSESITVRRIVDRYLEHGRIFIFHNNNEPEVFLGSADWMNRNIYRRIEVCFPIKNKALRKEIIDLVDLQLQDNKQAVYLNEKLENIQIETGGGLSVQSQFEIYKYLSKPSRTQSKL